MDDSWSWDGSIISLSASNTSSNPSPPVRSRVASTSSLAASQPSSGAHTPPEPLDVACPASPEPALLSTTPTAPPRAILRPERSPPSPTLPSSHDISPHPPSRTPEPLAAYPARRNQPPHPLASFLLAEHSLHLSPPASPTASVASSFPGSRSRLPSSGAASIATGRGRGRRRAGSATSTVSTDGSAHEQDSQASGEISSGGEDDHEHTHGALVMPSMHFGGASDPSRETDARVEREGGRKAKVLVLGKTAEERKTLTTLLSVDEDSRRTTSAESATGATDMSYSFLSTRPSERSTSSARSEREEPASEPPAASTAAVFEPLKSSFPCTASSSAFVDLFHPASAFEADVSRLAAELAQPLEQLEAKLSRVYPTTDGLAELVEHAGCGDFEAAFFLFSSPPTAAELAVARPLSHLIPLHPVLILPLSPTGKPQKTSALEAAVKEQLDTAGVRWLPAVPLGGRRGQKTASGLYMLPADLFRHHPPTGPSSAHSSSSGGSAPVSGGSTHASSPYSEGPASLTSSQELPPPVSPTFTASSSAGFRSSSASSRASSRSSSHHRSPLSHSRSRSRHDRRAEHKEQYSDSLASLYSLQGLLHSPEAPAQLRRERAKQFCEWREVEVAARGAVMGRVKDLPEAWGESALEVEEGRREVDYSRRVAERRAALATSPSRISPASAERQSAFQDDADVLADSDDEADEGFGSPVSSERYERGRSSTARNSFSLSSMDPTTPRVSHRTLPPLGVTALDGSGYFPSFPPPPSTSSAPPSEDPLATSFVSASSSGVDSSAAASSASTASSILFLPGASSDPFHLPSLLHLVGLNLRLAVLSPSFASPPLSPTASVSGSGSEEKKPRAAAERASGWSWARTAAVFGLVFAAGVVVGVQAASVADGRAGDAGGTARWLLFRA